jgi:hypothetical protein
MKMPEIKTLKRWLLYKSFFPNPVETHQAVKELGRYVLVLEKRVEELETGKQDTCDE